LVRFLHTTRRKKKSEQEILFLVMLRILVQLSLIRIVLDSDWILICPDTPLFASSDAKPEWRE